MARHRVNLLTQFDQPWPGVWLDVNYGCFHRLRAGLPPAGSTVVGVVDVADCAAAAGSVVAAPARPAAARVAIEGAVARGFHRAGRRFVSPKPSGAGRLPLMGVADCRPGSRQSHRSRPLPRWAGSRFRAEARRSNEQRSPLLACRCDSTAP